MWEGEGRSASDIAAVLGDVTRNGVLSKVHRLGLVSPNSTGPKGADRPAPPLVPRRTQPSRPVPAPDPGMPARAAVVAMPRPRRRATVAGLADRSPFPTCQFLRGEPKARDFCGAAVLERPDGRRSSYCPEHHALCWEPLVPRRRQAPKDAA